MAAMVAMAARWSRALQALRLGLFDAQGNSLPRGGLWLAQTPQMFSYALLLRALDAAANTAPDANAITDDASAVEMLGLSPRLIEGHPRNLKVTLPADIGIAEMYLAANE